MGVNLAKCRGNKIIASDQKTDEVSVIWLLLLLLPLFIWYWLGCIHFLQSHKTCKCFFGFTQSHVAFYWIQNVGFLQINSFKNVVCQNKIHKAIYFWKSNYWVVVWGYTLDIIFSSNHNIHKSSFGICFWASDPFFNRFN